MKNKIIKTEKEYNQSCERIYKLMHNSYKSVDPDSPEGEELELLTLLVEKYEHERYPIEAPTPVEAIKFRMEQMNLRQADVALIFGGKTRVSEVLNGKRPLTLRMITLLNRYLGIPLESLIAGNKAIKLEPQKQKQILKIQPIKQYFSKSQAALV